MRWCVRTLKPTDKHLESAKYMFCCGICHCDGAHKAHYTDVNEAFRHAVHMRENDKWTYEVVMVEN